MDTGSEWLAVCTSNRTAIEFKPLIDRATLDRFRHTTVVSILIGEGEFFAFDREIRSGFLFKCHGSYGALTVNKSGVDSVNISNRSTGRTSSAEVFDSRLGGNLDCTIDCRTIEIVAGVAKSACADWDFLNPRSCSVS